MWLESSQLICIRLQANIPCIVRNNTNISEGTCIAEILHGILFGPKSDSYRVESQENFFFFLPPAFAPRAQLFKTNDIVS